MNGMKLCQWSLTYRCHLAFFLQFERSHMLFHFIKVVPNRTLLIIETLSNWALYRNCSSILFRNSLLQPIISSAPHGLVKNRSTISVKKKMKLQKKIKEYYLNNVGVNINKFLFAISSLCGSLKLINLLILACVN